MNKARFPRVLCFEFVLAGVVDKAAVACLNYEGLTLRRALAFLHDEAAEQDARRVVILWMRAHPYDDLVVLGCDSKLVKLADQYLGFRQPRFHVISATTGGRKRQR
ncbi:hypothetical protein KCP69_01550 [Salmonella enterica subsp. enterica]|nr:hypothetical protein KCP69_01550 [Salmonella enterica subsp. enterica]